MPDDTTPDTPEDVAALLRRAAEALIEVGKKALVVKTTLDQPYSDAPDCTPWTRYMEEPARRAYNLGREIHRAVLALAEQQQAAPDREAMRGWLRTAGQEVGRGDLIAALVDIDADADQEEAVAAPYPHLADALLSRFHITERTDRG